ncbi:MULTISPECIES: hypothetical protein [Clostridium]|uniref:Uncharacterized protein n=2 Tax=Clostridium TaxID=1485 RepID=D8GMX0_CLOLD|nr:MULTISPECIES: hypothetical protein [Clostridium]ADK15758.1 hypothetical protein CLJU_c27000 [Clostridium ljungdahlii DSM 13528]AGY75011.1 hypothetical protein CAETHG_0784 [Clostridium autoethanogenum DSM 10061]ALU35185.1 Hypothetical protein CLAU_0756 [Clostridium autoethanogenum DSM 10061]OAA86387.1 hypothetical protein WX45_04051 [Clostridium ljungdahlii DSM 13528]OVY49314.1 hypothetical protein WX72_03664 [Clostridium autoethanogenum]
MLKANRHEDFRSGSFKTTKRKKKFKKVSTLKEAIKVTDTQALKIDKKVNIAPGIKATNLMRMIFYMIKAS